MSIQWIGLSFDGLQWRVMASRLPSLLCIYYHETYSSLHHSLMNYKFTGRPPIKLTLNHTINSFNSFSFHLDLFTCVLTKSCFDIAPTVPGGYSLVLASWVAALLWFMRSAVLTGASGCKSMLSEWMIERKEWMKQCERKKIMESLWNFPV